MGDVGGLGALAEHVQQLVAGVDAVRVDAEWGGRVGAHYRVVSSLQYRWSCGGNRWLPGIPRDAGGLHGAVRHPAVRGTNHLLDHDR